MFTRPRGDERLRGTGVTLNVACPGHAHTSMNRDVTSGAYPALVRPVVPLLRLAMPVLYGQRVVVKASRSSVHLASDPRVGGVHQPCFDARCRPTSWPEAVLDQHNRDTVGEVCEHLAG
ncbi:hypothetical protein ACFYOT_22870 [Saccharothrix saharensis]|uniref:hypothetical protein n=1 Tax=Saccharothrix saharensis TaxID=571190 RepID=UPI0036978551